MITSSTLTTSAQKSDLLETGQAAKLTKLSASDELPLVTYNIRWRTGAELNKICDWLKQKNAVIIALQEVDRARMRTKKSNNARELAERLGMYYVWAAPPPGKSSDEEETGVELLSPYPLTDVISIVLPNKGPGGRSRLAIGATIKIGATKIRTYSVHAENRLPEPLKVEQLKAILADLVHSGKEMPAIVMGDFNTWEPAMVDRTRELFTTEGFTTPFPDGRATFKRNIVLFDLELKLDWIWLRGLTAKSFGIDGSLTISDHFPLWAVVSLSPTSKSKGSASPTP